MSMFIKMGLNGTGFMGAEGSTMRAAQRHAARRKVRPGYPVDTPFKSADEVRHYLSGDKIVCLLCGRSMRRLAMHLPKIHGVSMDAYRAQYNIPWSYGLGCSDYSELIGSKVSERISEEGLPEGFGFTPPDQRKKPRKSPFKSEIARANLGEHLGSVKHGTDGKKEQRKAAERARQGSEEHRRKISAASKERSAELAKACHERFAGVPKSPEHRAAISAALLRRTGPKK